MTIEWYSFGTNTYIMLNTLLNCRTRAIVNYLLVAFLLLSSYLNFLSETLIFCNKILGSMILLLTILTNFKYGVIKVFSMKMNGRIERILAVLLIVLPFPFISFLGIYDVTFYVSLGATLIILNIITDYRTYRYRYTLI